MEYLHEQALERINERIRYTLERSAENEPERAAQEVLSTLGF